MESNALMERTNVAEVAGSAKKNAEEDVNGSFASDESLEQSPHDDPAERAVAYQALDAFHKYASMQHMTIHRRRQNLYSLPSAQWTKLAAPPFNLLDNLVAVDDAIDANARLARAIVDSASSSMHFPHDENPTTSMPWDGYAKMNDHNKAQSTLRQFYRDWTAEGYTREVLPLLNIILSDLEKHTSLPDNKNNNSHNCDPPPNPTNSSSYSHILLPGSGLSRLLLELTLRGHNVMGNEISYHQLMASNFILNNNPSGPNSWTIYPWATNFCDVVSRANQLRSYTMPDIDPATACAEARLRGDTIGEMGMASGDFCTSFNAPDSAEMFTSVVTAYFIDTSPNLFRYIQTVHNCLKPGGLWINVGPLLWHFDARPRPASSPPASEAGEGDDDDEQQQQAQQGSRQEDLFQEGVDTGIAEPGSFELSHDEVVALVAQSGFEILVNEVLPAGFDGGKEEGGGGPGLYLQDPGNMMQMRYRCGHWVARKVGGT